VLEAKAGMLLLSAYGRLLCSAGSGVAAMVGDGSAMSPCATSRSSASARR
jgi:hypothetical protein